MSYYHRDKVTDVMAVLKTTRGEFETRRNYRNTTELRKEAVKIIAETKLQARRYKNKWNPQGGVIHWTHHDPAGRHLSGWVKHNGRTYQ
jgi:hypothetical protein